MNAYTTVDHTCFTVTTVTSKCLLSILPTFVDHILRCPFFQILKISLILGSIPRPALSDASYLTEVDKSQNQFHMNTHPSRCIT